jgi:hypothetical protein
MVVCIMFFFHRLSLKICFYISYKCDSQCALEMRCPPGLVFDDLYQRCEWPGAGNQSPSHRLGSLRNKNDQMKTGKKQIRLMTTIKPQNSTVSSLNQGNNVIVP